MLKKQLYWTVGVIIFLFIVLGSVFCYQIRQDTLSARGQYTFKNTKNNIAKLSAIKINTAQSGEINMYLKDGAWYMKEAKDYFINPQALANFFNMINNSLVITKQKNFSKNFPSNNLLTEEESKNFVGMGTEIKTYDDNGNLLDDVIIGRPTGKSGHFFARQMKTAHQQIISGAEKFSGSAVDWLPLPLLQIEQKLVKMVDINGYSLDAEQLYFLWENSGLIKDFFAVLKNINYQGIIYRDEFFESSGEIIPQQLRITMMGGLIYNLEIYKTEGNYWLSVKLEAERVAHKDVFPFVEANQKYFDKWLFLLPQESGDTLYSLRYKPYDMDVESK